MKKDSRQLASACLALFLTASLLAAVILIPVSASASEKSVTILLAFPDANFRTYILNNILTKASIDTAIDECRMILEDVNTLNLDGQGIQSLCGIEYLPNITQLSVVSNQLQSLDLHDNTRLQILHCEYNQLKTINLNGCLSLSSLYCQGNMLSQLDLLQHEQLESLTCEQNMLSSLDLSNNRQLTFLSCGSNNLGTLDVSMLNNLTRLYCTQSQLQCLDVSALVKLTALSCAGNSLRELNVEENVRLTHLSCSDNQIEKLELGANTALQTLYCYSNRLYKLDLSSNRSLKKVMCSGQERSVTLVPSFDDYRLNIEEFDADMVASVSGATIKDGLLVIPSSSVFPHKITYTIGTGNRLAKLAVCINTSLAADERPPVIKIENVYRSGLKTASAIITADEDVKLQYAVCEPNSMVTTAPTLCKETFRAGESAKCRFVLWEDEAQLSVTAVDAAGNLGIETQFILNRFADCDGDGEIGQSDLDAVINNYQLKGRTLAEGDIYSDGIVDAFDLLIVLANYGR